MFKTLKNRFEPYIGRVPQRLSFIFAKDLATIVIAGMLVKNKYGSYNVSDGKSYDRYALADITKSILGIKTLKVHVPHSIVNLIAKVLEVTAAGKPGGPALNSEKLAELTAPNWECNIALLQKELAVAPAYDLRQGITETLQWYQSNKWL